MNGSNYPDSTPSVFTKLNTLKFKASQKNKVHSNLLFHNTPKLFEIRECSYDLRATNADEKKTKTRTNIKQRWVSVRGVRLWNNDGTFLKRQDSHAVKNQL